MRSIVKDLFAHKPRLRPGRFLLLALSTAILAVAAAGCGDREDAQESAAGSASAAVHGDSALVVDLRGWRDFEALFERIEAGADPTAADFADLARSEPFLGWSACAHPEGADAARVGRWLENAFADELDRSVPRKVNAERRRMATSYNYSRSHAEKIDELLVPWTEPEFRADFLEQVATWIAPELRPRPLTLRFLPAIPEIRNCGVFYVDTGVVAAGGNRQLRRQLTAMLYRSLMIVPEIDAPDNPRAPIAAVIREMLNTGVAVWIEQAPKTFFDIDHPELNDVELVPESFFVAGQRLTAFFDRSLPELLGNPDLTVEQARGFAQRSSSGVDLTQAGYAWAATIVHHFGEPRLREVCQSPAEFLFTYQEAALRNPVPRPRPGALGSDLAETQPPLAVPVYEQLLALLREFESD